MNDSGQNDDSVAESLEVEVAGNDRKWRKVDPCSGPLQYPSPPQTSTEKKDSLGTRWKVLVWMTDTHTAPTKLAKGKS